MKFADGHGTIILNKKVEISASDCLLVTSKYGEASLWMLVLSLEQNYCLVNLMNGEVVIDELADNCYLFSGDSTFVEACIGQTIIIYEDESSEPSSYTIQKIIKGEDVKVSYE